MSEKEVLRKAYEKKLGRTISDRTWQRIRNEYLAGEVNLTTVQGLALLRKEFPNQAIDVETFRRLERFTELLDCLEKEVDGASLLKLINSLPHSPSPRTLRRWGQQLGVRLKRDQWYTPEQVRAWIQKLLNHPKYGIKSKRLNHGTLKDITNFTKVVS